MSQIIKTQADPFDVIIPSVFPELAARCVRLLTGFHPEAHWIVIDGDPSIASKWNEGVRASKTSVLVFLNDDVELLGHLHDQLLHPADDEICADASRPTRQEPAFLQLFGQAWPQDFDRIPKGYCFSLTRERFEKLGPFDERFTPAYYEDTDFFYRHFLAGGQFHITPSDLIHHQGSSSSRLEKQGWPRRRLNQNNQKLWVEKWKGKEA